MTASSIWSNDVRHDTGDGARPSVTDAQIDTLASRLSNWGRWGPDDQLGALNLVTEEKRLEAASCIRAGAVHSLGLELRHDLPQPPGSGRLNPQLLMTDTGTDVWARQEPMGGSDDVLTMSVHAATHWDSLAHIFHRGWMYNERPCYAVTSKGAEFNDIVPVARKMVTRGVLVDVARHRGVQTLDPGYLITLADLEASLAEQRVEVFSGDVLLIRTGHLGRIRACGDWAAFTEVSGEAPCEPGIGVDCLTWMHERGVVGVACDNWAVEWLSGPGAAYPVHQIALVHMGMLLGEIFELDELAAACAVDRRYDFMLAAGPLPIRGGVGGPVNPMAIR
jgi:kynurenine formamidase